MFRGPLIAALQRASRTKGGRPPFDPVLMFKILVLQELYSLSDNAAEFQIKDRLSFQRFLGLGLDGRVPGATTLWLFGERMPERTARTNARRSAIRSAVEHVFAGQKHRMHLFVRTIGMARARIKIGMANLVYNFQRFPWLEGRSAPA